MTYPQELGASGHGNAGASYTAVSLCWLVKAARAGIATYTVKSIKVVKEPWQASSNSPSSMRTFAYVTYEQVAAWSPKTVPNPTARYWDCNGKFCSVSVKVGEQVLIFLDIPSPNNKGFYGAGFQFLWQSTAAGWTNGVLLKDKPVALDKLKADVTAMLTGLEKSGECPFDIVYKPGEPKPPADGAGVIDGGTTVFACVECPDAGAVDAGPDKSKTP